MSNFSPSVPAQLGANHRRATTVAAASSLVVLLTVMFAGSAAASEDAVAATAHNMPVVAGTPCTAAASACVDLDSQRAWLLKDGAVVRGPIKISSGGNGQETPLGHSLRVYRKDKDHLSQESRLPNGAPAPMPWSVFFEDGGIAFHGGDPRRSSAGCVHVPPGDAEAFFTFLQIGNQDQVVRAGQETAARAGERVSETTTGGGDRSGRNSDARTHSDRSKRGKDRD